MVLQALTLYALAAGLTGRPWAGVGAALAAAGLGPMPAYYLNWGRYTQLAGQVLLPAAGLDCLAVTAPLPASSGELWRGLAARRLGAASLVAGLALTHYLVTVFFALLGAGVGAGGPGAGPADGGGRATGGAGASGRRAARGLCRAAVPWAPRFLNGSPG